MSTISASTTSTTAYVVTADTTGTLVLKTGSTPTTAVTINGSQQVGINTTPTTVFHTLGANGTYATTLAESVTYAKLRFQNYSGSSLSLYQGVSNSSSANWYYQVANGDGSTAYDITLNPFGGNVGVGTTSPGSLLHLSKTLSGSLTSAIQIQNYGTFTWGIGIDNAVSNSSLVFQSGGAGGTTRMALDSSGNFLLGATSSTSSPNGISYGFLANKRVLAGNGVSAGGTVYTGGGFVSTAPWDGSASATHNFALSDIYQADNSAGMVVFTASNKGNPGKIGTLVCAFYKQRGAGGYITTISTFKSSNLTTLSVTADSTYFTVSTDSDCQVTYAVVAGA